MLLDTSFKLKLSKFLSPEEHIEQLLSFYSLFGQLLFNLVVIYFKNARLSVPFHHFCFVIWLFATKRRSTTAKKASIGRKRVNISNISGEETTFFLRNQLQISKITNYALSGGKADIVSEGATSVLWHTVVVNALTSQAHSSSGSPQSGR